MPQQVPQSAEPTAEDYTIGWICALPVELAASAEMLDNEHQALPQDPNDYNSYTFGRIGEHNVVIASLPAGHIGANSAATVATQMKSKFSSMRFGLMVGIGGGVSNEESDIRLGDVVISQPHMQFGGVVQYDFGKTGTGGQFTRTGALNSPPQVLLAALTKLRANDMRGKLKLMEHLSTISRLPKFTHQGLEYDQLYNGTYDHISGPTCKQCDKGELVDREPRESTDVVIHYGTIASGNQVVKDGVTRDRLSSELGGVLCFEMEAAGLMNNFPCLVIRGICDYADSHKNKRWQPYAAATAAACAKELLGVIPASQTVNIRTVDETMKSEVDTRLLDPAIESDRIELYRRYRASLHAESSDRDETHAQQAYLFSELMTWKYHAQGPWQYWLARYLKEGHSVNIRDFRGKTPLHHALITQYERGDKVRSLIEAGADVTMQDLDGQTPVDVAKEQDKGLFISLLRTWQQKLS